MSKINNLLFDEKLKNSLLDCINKCIQVSLKHSAKILSNKSDGTMVTSNDIKIDNIIRERLYHLRPDIPYVSEERVLKKYSFTQDIYWLVDPIDGTTSYVKGKDSYTINIALIFKGTPVLGYIANPPSNTIWYTFRNNTFMIKHRLNRRVLTTKNIKSSFRVIMSKTQNTLTNKLVQKINTKEIRYFSSSLKFCKIAEGKADIYPRLQSISKWDIAAGDAILRKAGGSVLDVNGKEYNYSSPTIKTGTFFALSSKQIWNTVLKNYTSLFS